MKVSINELINNPELIDEDSCNFFYDWFCKDSSLSRRAHAFIPKLKFLIKEEIIDGDKNCVWFKNNYPMKGTLYDDMRISNIETDEYLGGFCPRTGHKNVDNKCSVWILRPNYYSYDFKDWTEFKKLVKNDEVFKKELQKVFS